MELTLVTNPRSGSGRRGDDVAGRLRAHGATVNERALGDLGAPERRVRGEAAARVLQGAQRLVVAGGDGSVGLAAAVAAQAGVPLAIVPTGTANDAARALNLPLELDAACALAADPAAPRRALDLAAMGDRPFVNAASAGLAPAAAGAARP